MNRPKKSEYMKIGDVTTPYIFYQDRYMDALDSYCDELEAWQEHHQKYLTVAVKVTKINEVVEEIKRLEKALDKACAELEFKAKEINELHGYMDDKYVHKERWKDWCLNGE